MHSKECTTCTSPAYIYKHFQRDSHLNSDILLPLATVSEKITALRTAKITVCLENDKTRIHIGYYNVSLAVSPSFRTDKFRA